MSLDFDFPWFIIVGVFVAGFVFIFWFLKNINSWISFYKLGKKVYSNLPPGDLSWPLFGSSISFLRAFTKGYPDSFLTNIVSRFGRGGIYKIHLLGSPTIIVTEPEACRVILSNHNQFPSSLPTSVIKLLYKNRSVANAMSFELHKPLHRINSSFLTGSEALSMHVHYMEEIAIDFLDQWASMSLQNKQIELATETKAFTLKLICRLVFGPIVDPYLPQLYKLYPVLIEGVFSLFPYELPGSTFYRSLKARENIAKIIKIMMEEKKKGIKTCMERNEEKCLLEMVMEAKHENGQKLLDDEGVLDFVLLFVLAGEDSSAASAMWAMRYLATYPQVFAKAKEEQELIVKRRPPSQKGLTFKETKQMKYLAMVINETLRITNIAFSSFREAKIDTKLNGYTIPKGWRIAVWYRGIHMDPIIYPNPQKFDPSRWDNYTPKSSTFLPFGYGYRFCCGADYAKLELNVLLHHFLLNYKLELIHPECKATCLPFPIPKDNCLSRLVKLV